MTEVIPLSGEASTVDVSADARRELRLLDDVRRRPLHAAPKPARSSRIVAAYAVLAVLLTAYVVSVIVRRDDSSTLVDGWCVDAFELVASGLCLSRGLVRRSGRGVAIALGFGLLAWSLGDLFLTIESLGGVTPPTPSLADAFYLAFYPLTYVAVVLFMRSEITRATPPSWLDGAVAGLGAAALCAAFAFRTILHSVGGHPLATATDLAYPIGDLILLVLVGGATAMLSGKRRTPWLLVATACSLNAVGDTFNLFQSSSLGDSHVGTAFNAAAWPTAILLMSVAVWLRPRRADPLAPERPTSFVLPGIAAFAGLVILAVGTVHQVSRVSLALATAALVTAGVRMAISVGALRTVTQHKHRQSMTDDLTSLGNRRFLAHVLDAVFDDLSVNASSARGMAFLFVDLDHFKEINDSFGHPSGDELLRQLGPRLTTSLRDSDVLVRIGGDEFAVVLLDADRSYAASVAESINASLKEPFALDVVQARISASIGIALAPSDAMDSSTLFRCADVAMYRAKLSQSAFEFYDRNVDDGGNLLRLVEELRVAVAENQFVLHYQPQLDLLTGEIAAVEALLRWPHPRLGMIPPLKFIPLAEEAGLMPTLTALVLDDALAQCAAWRADGREIAVSVNVSPTNLLDPGFADLIKSQLARYDVPPRLLSLEITETCIISDYGRSRRVIEELRDLGIVMSIDDFGAGFTSLAYLGDLAVGELKLDRTFLIGLASERLDRDRELVRSTIALGHALGLRVVAEGIEDDATLQLLTSFGCDLAQGYFISRPVPASELEHLPGLVGASTAS